jgi:2-phospho-L-lactate guanylyltransferase
MSSNPVVAWCLVVPVKPLALAKSRLTALAGPARAEYALAFAADTVRAAVACPVVRAVVVVSDDPVAVPVLEKLGAHIVPDEPGCGLNPALTYGACRAAELWPGTGAGALCADLPALRPEELARALEVASHHPRAFVVDAAGTGTTLLTALPGYPLMPSFGRDSRTVHLRSGADPIDIDGLDSLRRDVDTDADLRQALRLGVGPRTATLPVAADGPA